MKKPIKPVIPLEPIEPLYSWKKEYRFDHYPDYTGEPVSLQSAVDFINCQYNKIKKELGIK